MGDYIQSTNNMEDRVFNQKWKIRVEAFKEINKQFFSEAKDTEPRENSSFDKYGPLLQEMIKDTNLVA